MLSLIIDNMKLPKRLLFSVFATLLLIFQVSRADTAVPTTATPLPPESDDLIPIPMNGDRPFQTYCYHCPPPLGCEVPEGKLMKCPRNKTLEPGSIRSSERVVCYTRTETIVKNHTESKTYIRLCTNVGAIKVNPAGTAINQDLRINTDDLQTALTNASQCFDINEANLTEHAKKLMSCRYCDPTQEGNGCNEPKSKGRSRKEEMPSVLIISVLSSLTALLIRFCALKNVNF